MSVMKVYFEYVVIWVKDICWYICFFEDVFGMMLCEVDGLFDVLW